MSRVTIEKLGKSFGTHRVLDGVDLTVEPGRLIAILGPSGSGKTTLLRLLCGFERCDDGSIGIDGRLMSGAGIHVPAERRQIGYVPQEGALFPHLSVQDNIVFGLSRAQRRTRHRVAELLELVGLPQSYAARAPQELSGGQQQRVALARALAPVPALVLLDEPFSALDAALRVETRQAVAQALEAAHATAVLVTHDQSEALSMGSEVAVLWDGRLIQVASPAVLYRHPVNAQLAGFVGEAVLLAGLVEHGTVTCALGRLPVAPGTRDGMAEVMVRPEQIRLLPLEPARADAPQHGSVLGVVREITYYGHDASVRIALPNTLQLNARVPGFRCPAVGEQVRCSVEGEAMIYPR
jgi:iron(III) transport system ATP-binding protein